MNTKFYFNHDYGARNDDLILELRAEFGWEGYGIFWGIIESICENSGGIQSQALAGLSLGLSVDKDKLKQIIDFCLEKKLLYVDNKMIKNKRIDCHFLYRKKLSKAGAKGGRVSKPTPNTAEEATLKPPLSHPEANKGKERKGKKSIEKTLSFYADELFRNRKKKYAGKYLLFVKTILGRIEGYERLDNLLKLENQCKYNSFTRMYEKAVAKKKKLITVVTNMDNKKDLLKKYNSVSKTALNWLDDK